MIPDDQPMAADLLQGTLDVPLVIDKLQSKHSSCRILTYIMQVMIVNTGEKWQFFRHHLTLAMFTDYIV